MSQNAFSGVSFDSPLVEPYTFVAQYLKLDENKVKALFNKCDTTKHGKCRALSLEILSDPALKVRVPAITILQIYGRSSIQTVTTETTDGEWYMLRLIQLGVADRHVKMVMNGIDKMRDVRDPSAQDWASL